MIAEAAVPRERVVRSRNVGARNAKGPVACCRPGLRCLRFLERETGFEPATSTLARWHSTAELLPQRRGDEYLPPPRPSNKKTHLAYSYRSPSTGARLAAHAAGISEATSEMNIATTAVIANSVKLARTGT